ncbi:MAG: LCP family protein [Solirubrobacterales bacterium]
MTDRVLRKPPPEGDHEPPPKPRRFWIKFSLAAVVIIAVSAAATATSILLYIGSIAHALSHNNVYKNKLGSALAEVHGGGPETILIIGSDKRANLKEDPGRSDTTMLLRLDPERNAISVMSIPRDLKVEIPGYGINKFNAAYTYGGAKLTLRMVKELTGLSINHVVNVDFLGFVRAVDAIGCVYVDVDRRYYHNNAESTEEYSEINVQPGYQLLCGKKALQYVRYRHTDTDLVRNARQQDFISEARQRVPVGDLLLGRNDLINIFTHYTTSDISDTATMIQMLDLFVESRNATIDEVHFPAVLGPSYVYSSPAAIQGAVKKFLGSEASPGPRGSLEGSNTKQAKPKKAKGSRAAAKPKPPGSDGLVPAVEAGLLQGKAVARKANRSFPVFFPTRLPSGAYFVENDSYEHVVNPRVYRFKDENKERHLAYRMVAVLELPDGLHYFGVQGIQGWHDPPILENPSETKTIQGREYVIFYDGERVKMIAWHRGENTYWVANDLLDTLTNDQMVGIARSAKVLIPKRKNLQKAAKGG